MNKYIVFTLILCSCSSQLPVESAINSAKDCSYLLKYTDSVAKALQAKDYSLALNVANAAYLRTLESTDNSCVNDAKQLVEETTNLILKDDVHE
jgi:hypothetical protein